MALHAVITSLRLFLNARLPQASLGRRHADVASKRPVAQRNDDGVRASRAYARRSPVPERACPTRPRRRVASTSPDARTRRRSFGWCRTTCSACRRSMTTVSRASTARGGRWSRRSRTSSSRVGYSSTASPASAATTVRTSTNSRSPARAATSVRAVAPSASRSGPSGSIRPCSRRCRTDRWCSPSPSGCAPTVCIAAACSARSPVSPPAPSPPPFGR